MIKRKSKSEKNYLDLIPVKNKKIKWTCVDENVTLEIENAGFINKTMQFAFKKPKVSYIHLDKMGSFVWNKIDGSKRICDFGKDVMLGFGDEAQPIYERLAQYFNILKSNGFIDWVNQ